MCLVLPPRRPKEMDKLIRPAPLSRMQRPSFRLQVIAHLVTSSGARTVVVFKRKRCRIPAFNDFAPVNRYRLLALVLVGATVLCLIVLRAGQTQSSVLRRVT